MSERSVPTATVDPGHAPESRPAVAVVIAYIMILAWAPFPLGSNRPWSWNLLILLVGICWISWGVVSANTPQRSWSMLRRYPAASALALCSITWAILQSVSTVPADWVHPIWSMASSALGQKLPATISMDPWRTQSDCLKLCSYVMALWLAFAMARRTATATLLLDALIAIGTTYALYSAVLKLFGFSQYEVFYSVAPTDNPLFAGPFVLHNSYATFAGLTAIAALARLASIGRDSIVTGFGIRLTLLTALQFLLGRGATYLIAFLAAFSTLLASASRAGFLATLCGLLAMLTIMCVVGGTRVGRRWSLFAISSIALVMIGLVVLSSETLAMRLNDLVDAGSVDSVRLALWQATSRMIVNAPLLGLGLGTFTDAYPIYATEMLPFTMDKAHNDYLEFVAGLGLPGALAWWTAWLLLVAECMRGVFRRRRNRHFVILAVGASVLIAVHSAFDFSLQIPAIPLFYATILGIGLAQSRSANFVVKRNRV